MRKGSGFNIWKIILSFLFLAGGFLLHAQGTSIGGVVNQYRRVVSIPGTDNVTLTDASLFLAGDTVLLIQMKGVEILVDDLNYGKDYTFLGTPGAYEFLIIESVSGNNIIFTSNISNNYDVEGLVQLINVPYYNSATVNTGLTCQPWDSTTKTGGVLAMIVGRTLTLEADIDVSGKGFAGGAPSSGQGICIKDNLVLYDKYSYPDTYTNSGFKGEGLAIRAFIDAGNIPALFPEYAKGKGANFTAGGGGNGGFSGGGGGAGFGFGGSGGKELNLCFPPYDGGIRGQQVKNTTFDGFILLGSGGGSSTFGAGGTASPGGSGGGIIIIVCDTLKGNGHKISAEGMTPAFSASGNAGAGGGGGGGSIALYQRSFSTYPLIISANGGNGGSTNNSRGDGGGGGGGLILTNDITFPSNVERRVAGGGTGTTSGLPTGSIGADGITYTTFTPLLNGFLFNSIRSSVSNNQLDSVCSNMTPPKILGSTPVGGSGSYTFKWEKSFEATFTSPVTLTNDANPVNYTPKPSDAITATDSVWFRRIVNDFGTPVINDTSKAVKFIVHPAISNNIVGNQDTICFNGNPPLIQQLLPDLIVPTTKYLFYSWQDSSSTATWGSSISTGKNYDPPAGLSRTTWYRRSVISGSCKDSSAKVRMTVIPNIANNVILSVPQDICFGTAFNALTATTAASTPALSGGDNNYIFKWISDINSAGWSNAPGAGNLAGYNPVELPQRIPSNEYSYRRIVYSGSHNVCVDTSNTVHLRDYPVITNNVINTITTNQPICSGSAPAKITGPQPSNGNGIFKYTWQDSTNSAVQWKDIPGAVNSTSAEYQPPVLTTTTSYRRIALSSECTDISNAVRIIVHPPVLNNNISLIAGGALDTTICNGQVPHRFTGTAATGGNGIYSYQWLDSTASHYLSPVGGATQVSFQNPSGLNVTTFYKRQVTSGACIVKSGSTITVNVLSPITNNEISAGQPAVCENTAPEPITGLSLSGGSGSYSYLWEQSADGGASWAYAAGTNNQDNYQPPVLNTVMMYRRTVTSGPAGCCTNTSPAVDISILLNPQSPVNAGNDAAIYSIDKSYTMDAAAPVITGETGFWTVLEPATALINNISDSKTLVRNLSTGDNFFVWTITNGPCQLEDTVVINLRRDFIPQGFSPNGDAWNNTFIIEGLDFSDQQIADLTVVNGAGTPVFSTSNRDGQEWVNWQGKNDKGLDLPEGTYYYLLKVTTKDNKVIRKSGFVVLKRY